ncbi:MAG: hypothetical protein WCE73_19620 [Candidatus Angelobacter sp.]
MAANQQIPFLHHKVSQRHTLIESVCPSCGDFVAASSNQTNLAIAELAHTCSTDSPRANAKGTVLPDVTKTKP